MSHLKSQRVTPKEPGAEGSHSMNQRVAHKEPQSHPKDQRLKTELRLTMKNRFRRLFCQKGWLD